MTYHFHTLDVFTQRRYAGNPLAVVLSADDLSTEQMQAITREFNLSETTFVRKPAQASNTAEVRIFCPGGEMPFAGHPTVGTAILLAELANRTDDDFETEIRLELKAGLTPVKVKRVGGRLEAMVTAPLLPTLSQDDLPALAEVAKALGVAPEDIGFDRHKFALTQGGIGFLIIPLKSRAALAGSRIIEPYWSDIILLLKNVDAAYVYTRGGDRPGTDYSARMYGPTSGIPEDPATGSAAVQMAAQLLLAENLADGSHRWRFEQGYDMGRPSDLILEADIAAGRLTEVRIAGSAVQVMEGRLSL